MKLSITLCILLQLIQKLVHNVYAGTLQRRKVYQIRSIASWGKQIKAVQAVNKNARIQLFKPSRPSTDPTSLVTLSITHNWLHPSVFSETILFEHFVITLEPFSRHSYGKILVLLFFSSPLMQWYLKQRWSSLFAYFAEESFDNYLKLCNSDLIPVHWQSPSCNPLTG